MTMADKIWDTLSKSPGATTAFAALGGVWTSYQLYKLSSFTYEHFVRPSSLNRYKTSSSPSWALITGASDGIGKGFAEELCERGFNVVLHGRNEKKLNAVKDGLKEQWPDREVRIMVLDAGNETGDYAKMDSAVQQLQDINLKVLINNVGGGGGVRPVWIPLQDSTEDWPRMILDLNARFPTEITKRLLPQFIKNSPALIMNIGSVGGEVPSPYITIYAGAKSYNKAWSRSLALELRAEGQDVEVLHQLVGMVSSGSEPRDTSLLCPSSRRMAQGSLDKVGCGKAVVFGYWPHELQCKMFADLPAWIGEKIILSIALSEKQREGRQLKEQ